MQPKIRQTTNVDSVSGAQVDPFIPRRITAFVLFGFCNVLVRARRMCLDALACITTVDLARRYELYTCSARLAIREVIRLGFS